MQGGRLDTCQAIDTAGGGGGQISLALKGGLDLGGWEADELLRHFAILEAENLAELITEPGNQFFCHFDLRFVCFKEHKPRMGVARQFFVPAHGSGNIFLPKRLSPNKAFNPNISVLM